MEEDNMRRRLPSLPSNYVTILQLKERWIKDQKQKQNKDQQLKQKSESEPELEPKPNPQEQREIRDVLEKSVVAVCLASCETADMKIETEELKIAKRKWWQKKSENCKSKGRAQAATIAAEDEAEVAGGEEIVPQTKEASLKSRNGRRLRKLSTDGGREREKNGSERKPEGAVCLVSRQITDKKGKTWKSEKNQGKKEWKKVKEKRVDEEVAGGEAHAPQMSDEKEEMKKLGNAVVADQTVEIEGRLKDMSIKVGRERANEGPEMKPEGDVCLVSCQITDKEKTWKSKKNQGKREWKKVKEKKDDEEAAGGEAHALKTSDEKEGDVCLVSCQFTDKKENTWKLKKNQGKIEWRKVKEKKDDEEVAGCEAHVPKTSDEKEVMAKSGNAVFTDQMVEIEGRMNGMSIKGGRERGNDALVRPNNEGHYRGGYQRFDNGRLRKERKPRNARMICVKKGDTSGGNADEVHSSIVY